MIFPGNLGSESVNLSHLMFPQRREIERCNTRWLYIILNSSVFQKPYCLSPGSLQRLFCKCRQRWWGEDLLDSERFGGIMICSGSQVLATSRRGILLYAPLSCVNGYQGSFLFAWITSHLVQVKTLDRQQHWVKNACEQIGLGNGRLKSKAGKVVDKIIFLQVYDLWAGWQPSVPSQPPLSVCPPLQDQACGGDHPNNFS